jgi:hypothetical protein
MIRTEQLTPDTMMFHVQGEFDPQTAKELSLSVFSSYHLEFKTFLCNLSRALPLDESATNQLVLIGKGLRNKGKTWRVIGPPSSIGDQLIFRTTLQYPLMHTGINLPPSLKIPLNFFYPLYRAPLKTPGFVRVPCSLLERRIPKVPGNEGEWTAQRICEVHDACFPYS